MSSLGKNGIFSNRLDLTTPSTYKKLTYTTKKKKKTSTTAAGKKKQQTVTRQPARKRKAQQQQQQQQQQHQSGVDGDDDESSGKKKRARTTAPRKTDLNVKRNLPDKFMCNGRTITNQFKPIIQDSNADQVIAYFSSYAVGPSGAWESNLVKGLVKMINHYGKGKTVVGCVAWLSNQEILTALQGCARVLLIVNREDYSKWGNGAMLDHYKKLPKFDTPMHIAFSHLDSALGALETNRVGGKSKYASVRAFGTAGFAPGRKGSSGGLEHCKYLVFFENKCFKKKKFEQQASWTLDTEGIDLVGEDKKKELYDYQYKEVPCAVWTGSMNMTKASETNHENAVFIKSSKVALGFFHDFSNTFMVSTPVSSSKTSKGTPSEYIQMKA